MAKPASGGVKLATPAKGARTAIDPPAAPAEEWTSTSHSKTNADGTVTLDLYSAPMFHSSGGNWQPIDPAVKPAVASGQAATADGAVRPMKFGTSSANLLGIDLDQGRVTVSAPSLQIGTPTIDASQVTYTAVAPDTDLRYRTTSSGVKQEFVLHSAQSPTQYTFHLSDSAHQLGKATLQKDGGYSFDAVIDSGLHFTIPPAVAYQDPFGDDTGSATHEANSGHLAVKTAGDGFDVTVSVDPAWLKNKAYPIILDPTISFNDGDGTLVRNGWASYSGGQPSLFNTSDGLLNVGVYNETNMDVRPARSFVQFDVSKIPAASSIQLANMYLYYGDCVGYNSNHVGHTSIGIQYCSSNNYTVEAHSMTHAWTGAENAATLWSYINPTVDTTNTIQAAPPPPEYAPAMKSFSLINDVYSWINTPSSNNGIALKLSNDTMQTSVGGPAFFSSRTAYNFRPSLKIQYSPPAGPPQSIAATSLLQSGNQGATVTWSPGLGDVQLANITSYDVVAQLGVSPFTQIGSTVNVCITCPLTATFQSLTPGTQYRFGVRSNTALGSSPYAYSNNVTVGSVPSAVVNATVNGVLNPTVVGRGQLINYSLEAANTNASSSQAVTALTEALPSYISVVPGTMSFKLGSGATTACSPTSSPITCVVSGATLTLGNVTSSTIASGAKWIFTFQAVATGSDRRCDVALDGLTVTNASGISKAIRPLPVCDSGLGLENWWSYVSRDMGAGATASGNVANGNLVVQQTDTAPVQAHGKLAYVLRRTYNSQDATAITLPGASIGAGWTLNMSEASDVLGGGLGATGLYVPDIGTVLSGQDPISPLAVTLIDRDGTRHVFTPKTALAPLANASVAGGAITPRLLGLNTGGASGYNVCVDESYNSPPGVHLALYRYIRVSGTCASPSAKTILGFGAVRPDRVRYEFSWDGQLVSMSDASGVRFNYVYQNTPLVSNTTSLFPVAGQPLGKITYVYEPSSTCTDPSVSTCRAFRFSYFPSATCPAPPTGLIANTCVTDPAGRRTQYAQDNGLHSHLAKVINDGDGTTITYSYGTCGGTFDQLCQASTQIGTNPAFNVTKFAYLPAPIGIPRLSSVTDRRNYAATFNYENADYVHVDQESHRTRFESIDTSGRVGIVGEGDVSDNYSRQYFYTWDTAAVPCRQPTGAVDNNLCGVKQMSLAPGFSQNQVKSFTYNDEGRLLIEDDGAGAKTTHGYVAEFFSRGASGAVSALTPSATDTVTGSGNVVSAGVRGDATTLYVVSDQTQSLTPRGNSVGGGFAPYLTTYKVDNSPAATPGATPLGTVCTAPNSPSANTGGVCEIDGPGFDATHTTSITQYTYDTAGQRLSMLTPKAQAQGGGAYTYTYYADTDRDLSTLVSAGGWLRAVKEPAPTSRFVAFAYDRGGNLTRTWDRDATAGHQVTDQWNVWNAGLPNYTEVLHATGTLPAPYGNPWRFVLSSRNQPGETTTYVVDPDGNQTTITSPKGNQTIQTFDGNDNLLSRLTPQEKLDGKAAWQYTYDQFNNLTSLQDPRGVYQTYSYDRVNRLGVANVDRGAPTATNVQPAGCNLAQSADAPLPLGHIVCFQSFAYDGQDQTIVQQDGNGEDQLFSYDALGRRLTTSTPRFDGVFNSLQSAVAYDLDGHVTDICSPRQYMSGETRSYTSYATACAAGPGAPYSTKEGYDAAGRLVSKTTYRSNNGSDPGQTTTFGYDGDGNLVSTTPPNNAADPTNFPATTAAFDFMDRRISVTVPRSSSTSFTTNYTYSGSGDLLSVTAPGSPATRVTAYSYDPAHRLVDTVVGSDNTDATMAGRPDAPSNTKNVRTRRLYDTDGNLVATLDARAFVCKTPPCAAAPYATPGSTAYMTVVNVDADGRPTANFAPRYDPTQFIDTVGAPDAGLSTEQTNQCATSNRPQLATPTYPATTGVCVTKRSYDEVGNVKQLTLPTSNGADNRKVLYGYSPDNLLVSVDTPSPRVAGGRAPLTTLGYDGVGREVLRTLPDITTPSNRYRSTVYNSDGTVKMVTVSGLSHNTRYSYDANGNATSVLDAMGKTSTASYFADDRLQSASDPLVTGETKANTTTYGYDNNGNVTSVMSPSASANDGTNPVGLPTTNTYTADDLLAKTKVPVDATSATATLQRLRRLTYTYDGGGRKLTAAVDVVDGTTAETVKQAGGTQTSSWYQTDHLATESPWTGTGNHSYSYDPVGNPLQSTDTTNGSSSATTSNFYLDNTPRVVGDGAESTYYSFDAAGTIAGRKQITLGGAAQVTSYAHNDADLVQTMTSDVGGATATQYIYDDAGRPDTEVDPNSQYTKYVWNQEDTLQSRQLKPTQASGTDLAKWVYNYDAMNRQKDVTFNGVDANGVTVAAGTATKFVYDYDEAGRVKSFTPGANTPQTYTYDHDGNRLTSPQGPFTYNADDSMKTSPVGPTGAYGYDAAGNLKDDKCRLYGYDGFNRMTSAGASSCDSTAQVTYLYDAFDRQRSRTETATTTSFHYDGLNDAVASEDQGGVAATETLYGLDATAQPTALKTGTTGTPSYLSDNGRDITTITSTGASVTCTARYDPPGTPVSNTGGSVGGPNKPCSTGTSGVNDVFYASARRDKNTGNYQLGARTYDPSKASFTTADSSASQSPTSSPAVGVDPLTRNTYSYVNGDPINLVDPSGHDSTTGSGATAGWLAGLAASGQELTPAQAATGQRAATIAARSDLVWGRAHVRANKSLETLQQTLSADCQQQRVCFATPADFYLWLPNQQRNWLQAAVQTAPWAPRVGKDSVAVVVLPQHLKNYPSSGPYIALDSKVAIVGAAAAGAATPSPSGASEGPTGGGPTELFHGTSANSARSLLDNGLSVEAAAQNTSGENELGFYLSTNDAVAEYFGSRQGTLPDAGGTTVLRYTLEDEAMAALTRVGAVLRPIPQGNAIAPFEGEELFVPTRAFETFQSMLARGLINVEPFPDIK